MARLAGERLRQQLAAGQPGPEGSAAKLVFARLNQEISGFEVELLGEDGLRYDDWTHAPAGAASDFIGRGAGYRYLRAKGNSIEGGTSEILRNIIAERVLGLPPEIRVDKDVAVEGPAPMTATDRSQRAVEASRTCCTPRPRTSCGPPCAACSPTGPRWPACWPGPRPRETVRHRRCGGRWPPSWAAPGC